MGKLKDETTKQPTANKETTRNKQIITNSKNANNTTHTQPKHTKQQTPNPNSANRN